MLIVMQMSATIWATLLDGIDVGVLNKRVWLGFMKVISKVKVHIKTRSGNVNIDLECPPGHISALQLLTLPSVIQVANQAESRLESICRYGQVRAILSTMLSAQNVTKQYRCFYQIEQWVTYPSTNCELHCLTS